MFQCYVKETINAYPLKPEVMKLRYIRKIKININGTTIHSTLAILLNSCFNELKTSNDEKHDTLIKPYIQFQLVVIDEYLLIIDYM
jgi:hypothetical protein